ncbi:MAG: lipooligosaccharide transport system permease protein [Flavobacteriales bacterium]|jgi:lipooligosaccharide transport system permease protein
MRLPGDIDVALALAVWRRNVTVYRRTWKMNILPNFFEPILYLVGMGIGLGAYLGQDVGGMPYLAYIAPGLLASACMNGAVFETTYNMFIKMNFARLYDAFLGTPAQVQDIAAGELLWAVTRSCIYGFAFLVVAGVLTVGFELPLITSPGVLFAPLIIVLTGALFAAIGELFTSFVKNIDIYSYFYTLFYTPLFLFSGIFYPVNQFPYGEQVAWFMPLYHPVRVLRALLHGGFETTHALSIVWMIVVTGVLFAIVPGRMRRQLFC